MEFIDLLRLTFRPIFFFTMVVGLIFLIRHKQRDKLHNNLIFIINSWIICEIFVFISNDSILTGPGVILPFNYLIAGTILTISTLTYPILALKPHWLKGKNMILYITPPALLIFIFILHYAITGKGTEPYYSFNDVFNARYNLGLYIRISFLLLSLAYIFKTISMVLHMLPIYNKFIMENFADDIRYNLKWLKKIAFFMVGMTLVFSLVMFVNTYIVRALYFLVVISLWIYLLENAILHKAFTKMEMIEKRPATNEKENQEYYKAGAAIHKWMMESRIHLGIGFTLQDVINYTGYNRRKLTKIFAIYFGDTFLTTIQKLRIEESKTLMRLYPDLSFKEISSRVGFNSPASFTRSFTQITGTSPSKYRSEK